MAGNLNVTKAMTANEIDQWQLLDQMLRDAKENVDYFSNKNKPCRELWVVNEFLCATGISFNTCEIKPREQHEPFDVEFRNAKFQVKELPDPELRRGKQLKDVYNSIKSAESIDQIKWVGESRATPPIAKICNLVCDLANALAVDSRYLEIKEELDLLVYVTRSYAAPINIGELSAINLAPTGWRSVTCINTKQVVVMHAAERAPDMLRQIAGQVIHRSQES